MGSSLNHNEQYPSSFHLNDNINNGKSFSESKNNSSNVKSTFLDSTQKNILHPKKENNSSKICSGFDNDKKEKYKNNKEEENLSIDIDIINKNKFKVKIPVKAGKIWEKEYNSMKLIGKVITDYIIENRLTINKDSFNELR